ncbi:hypothetical protein [Amycolatopsis minnesotensis]|uniref:WXG100 family type VII secretion target n=1 Tax=Amycolatopsis minnesotensis TaxID=337894 RepID=A0ABP5DK90_9PSEU
MSHTTTVDKDKIFDQANKHEQFAQEMSQELDKLLSHIESTTSASPSEATKALSHTAESWIASVKKTVLEHVNTMATNIRNEANNQTGTDESLVKQINSVQIETSNFLGGS